MCLAGFWVDKLVGGEGIDGGEIQGRMKMMAIRTETVPVSVLHLGEGEKVSGSEVRDGAIIVTITTTEASGQTREAGREFLAFSRKMRKEAPIDVEKMESNPDPRLRAILDDVQE